jgi:hypothetical protein
MTELASLVVSVKSDGVKAAAGDLAGLAKQGKAAETATEKLASGFTSAAKAAGVYADASGRLREANGRFLSDSRKSELGLKGVESQLRKTSAEADRFGAAARQLVGALAIGATFQAVIRNTIESENALAQLNATLKSTKGAAGLTSDEIVTMAQGLQKVTTFGDDAIIAMESQLLTFTKLGRDVVPQASEAILDLATKMGGDLKGATVQIGKALNDPIQGISALTKVGVTFNDAQKETIKQMVEMGDVAGAQSLILQELQTEFGGSARAARDTFGGAITALHNTFGDLLEGSGGNLNDAKAAVEGLNTALSDPEVQRAFGVIVSGVLKITQVMADALPVIVGFTESLGEGLARLVHGTNAGDLVGQMDLLIAKQQELAGVSQRMGQSGSPERAAAIQKEIDAAQGNIEAILNTRLETGFAAAASRDAAAATTTQTTATVALLPHLKTEAELKKESTAAAKEKAAALKIEKTATDALLKAQQDTVRAAEQAQANTDSKKALLGQVDPITGEQQKHQKELDDLRLLNANKLLEDQRYLELKTQAETAHDEQMRILQEENFRRQSTGNELLMASLDQLQVGATNALVGLATGANNGEEAVRQLATSILNEGVGALVQMGVQVVKNMIMGQAAQAATTATSVASAATATAAWTPAAAAASIGSFGGAAAAGLAGMAAAIPAMIGLLSFDGGGFTGSGSRSGGMDGKGGFPAMLHPNETVIDHTKGQSTGGGVTVNVIESSEKAGQQEKSTNADGSEAINVFVADIFGDGPRSQAIRDKFGLAGVGR